MHKKRRRVLLAVAVIVILGVAIVLSLEPWEPVYQGKPLSFWLQAYRIPPFMTPAKQRWSPWTYLRVGSPIFPGA